MKKFGYALATLLVLVFAQTQSAHANSCASKGRSLAASKGGKFLSAQAAGANCRIVILVKSGNGPPRRRTFTVRR
ncbi:MAG: hypothetical protein AAF890_07820 [Pseudomonadota bacterium]